MFVFWILLGGSIGVVTMALLQASREDIPVTVVYKPSNNLPECQIHPSFGCIDSTWCSGNPQLCENAILKEEEHE